VIKGILFDMDGVLVDAKEWHYEALNDALALFGMEISRVEHLSAYDGLPTKKKLEMLTKIRDLPVQLHTLLNAYKQQRTFELTIEHCRPVFHHQYAISRLKRDGYKIAVCSNSIRKTVETMMEQSALLPYLDFFLSNQDVTLPKPDPEIYSKAIEQMRLTPEECLILEDNDHGIKAAKASGAHVLMINTVNDVTYDRITTRIREIEGMAS